MSDAGNVAVWGGAVAIHNCANVADADRGDGGAGMSSIRSISEMDVVRRKKAAKTPGRKPTKDRILDAAEHLFATHGFTAYRCATSPTRSASMSRW